MYSSIHFNTDLSYELQQINFSIFFSNSMHNIQEMMLAFPIF